MEVIFIAPLFMVINKPSDRLYGTGKHPGELLLHAADLTFHHPLSGQRMSYQSPPSF